MIKKILAIPLLMFAFVSIMAVDLSAQEALSIISVETATLPADLTDYNYVERTIIANGDVEKTYSKVLENGNIETYIVQPGSGYTKIKLSTGLDPALYEYNVSINDEVSTTRKVIIDGSTIDSGDYYIFIGFDEPLPIDETDFTWGTTEVTTIEKPGAIETIFGTISAVVLGGIGLLGGLFTGDSTIINVFWTPATETDPGSLTLIGYLTLIPVGFVLVRWGFGKVLSLLRMRG